MEWLYANVMGFASLFLVLDLQKDNKGYGAASARSSTRTGLTTSFWAFGRSHLLILHLFLPLLTLSRLYIASTDHSL
jgi:hypothetical protein